MEESKSMMSVFVPESVVIKEEVDIKEEMPTMGSDEELGEFMTSDSSLLTAADIKPEPIESVDCGEDYPDMDWSELQSGESNSQGSSVPFDNEDPAGIATTTALLQVKKQKRVHSFETNPSIRKRQQIRLLRKLRRTIDELDSRVGQQAAVVLVIPGKPQNTFTVFGTHPMENVMKNVVSLIMKELETALAQIASSPVELNPSLSVLPPHMINDIPSPTASEDDTNSGEAT